MLNDALRESERLSSHDYLIIIISDLSGWNGETVKRIKRLARHNDVMVSLVFDPLEKTLPDKSQLILSDGEMQIQVDAAVAGLAEQFTEHFESSVEYLQSELSKHGIPVIPMSTTETVLDQIREAIGEHRSANSK
jgi:hypothetical protein